MFALIDCNNFYVSCERLFRPALRQRPVAVLSNNDGCIIARSNEVKELGVKMGTPYFEARALLRRHQAVVFSSNYALYGDLSARVMEVLRRQSRRLEVYSIDEAFVDLEGIPSTDWEDYGRMLRERVWREVGIPVSVGLARTKTLAKIGNHWAKRGSGVHALMRPSLERAALESLAVGEVWGIGRRLSQRLHARGVHSAMDFSKLEDRWVRREMTITGLRTLRELRGESCIPLELETPPRKSMVYSRSFGAVVRRRHELELAVANFAARLAFKLRRHQLKTDRLQLFLRAGRLDPRRPLSAGKALRLPSQDTRVLIRAALELLRSLPVEGYPCRKAGLLAPRLQPERLLQPDLFDVEPDRQLMTALDSIERRHGRRSLCFGAQGLPRSRHRWEMKQARRSPRYTTHWGELRTVELDALPPARRSRR